MVPSVKANPKSANKAEAVMPRTCAVRVTRLVLSIAARAI